MQSISSDPCYLKVFWAAQQTLAVSSNLTLLSTKHTQIIRGLSIAYTAANVAFTITTLQLNKQKNKTLTTEPGRHNVKMQASAVIAFTHLFAYDHDL